MKPITSKFLVTLIIVFTAVLSTSGQNTYEDLQGRFVIDLPNKWTLQPQEDHRVFTFARDGRSIIIQYHEDQNDPKLLFQKGIDLLVSVGYPNPTLDTEVKEMTVNGHQARSGVYKSTFQSDKNSSVTLYTLIGSLGFEENGLYMVGILNESDIKKWMSIIEKSFQSIRLPGEEITGVSDIKILNNEVLALDGPSDQNSEPDSTLDQGEPTSWSHSAFSMTLPPGWETQELSRNAGEKVIGKFGNKNIPGASVALFCYKGMLWSKKTVTPVADEAIKGAMPDAQLIKNYQIKLNNKKKADVLVYQGTAVSEGKEMELGSVNLIYRAGKYTVHQMGIVAVDKLSVLEEEMLAMANSIK